MRPWVSPPLFRYSVPPALYHPAVAFFYFYFIRDNWVHLKNINIEENICLVLQNIYLPMWR